MFRAEAALDDVDDATVQLGIVDVDLLQSAVELRVERPVRGDLRQAVHLEDLPELGTEHLVVAALSPRNTLVRQTAEHLLDEVQDAQEPLEDGAVAWLADRRSQPGDLLSDPAKLRRQEGDLLGHGLER